MSSNLFLGVLNCCVRRVLLESGVVSVTERPASLFIAFAVGLAEVRTAVLPTVS